jgi:WbqC-like protein family
VLDTLLIDLHYLPCLDYMSGLLAHGRVTLEAQEHYQKQSYRNRCYVRSAHAVERLTVPVLDGTHKQLIRDVQIDYSRDWAGQHWRCWQSAYGKAPFFEFYGPELQPIYARKPRFLFDLNLDLLTKCLSLLGARVNLSLTETYQTTPDTGILDARNRVGGPNQAGESFFGPTLAYSQNFGYDFVPNLSILDLLFCAGPTAIGHLNPVSVG